MIADARVRRVFVHKNSAQTAGFPVRSRAQRGANARAEVTASLSLICNKCYCDYISPILGKLIMHEQREKLLAVFHDTNIRRLY